MELTSPLRDTVTQDLRIGNHRKRCCSSPSRTLCAPIYTFFFPAVDLNKITFSLNEDFIPHLDAHHVSSSHYFYFDFLAYTSSSHLIVLDNERLLFLLHYPSGTFGNECTYHIFAFYCTRFHQPRPLHRVRLPA